MDLGPPFVLFGRGCIGGIHGCEQFLLGRGLMPSRSWYPRYMADYADKTRWFNSSAQHGIYSVLLDEYYSRGESLPDDDDELRGVTRATEEEWARYWPKIKERMFLVKNGRLHNKRADEEIRKYTKKGSARSKAAKEAAEIRWAEERKKKAAEGQESAPQAAQPELELRSPPVATPARQAIDLYNEMAKRAQLSVCQKIGPDRIKLITARLADCGGLTGWKAALEKVEQSDFLTGRGREKESWRANIDFLCKEKKFTKIMEGAYDNGPSNGGIRSRQDILEGALRGVASTRLDNDG